MVRVAAERSIALRVRLLRLARAEVERRAAPRLPRTMTAEVGFAVEDARLLMDIVVECPLAEPSAGEGAVEEEAR